MSEIITWKTSKFTVYNVAQLLHKESTFGEQLHKIDYLWFSIIADRYVNFVLQPVAVPYLRETVSTV